MAPELRVEENKIDVSDVQINEAGKVPFFKRTILADEPEALVISGRRAAINAQEIVGSNGFNDLLVRYEELFKDPIDSDAMLERRQIDETQKISSHTKEQFKDFCVKVANYDGVSEAEMDISRGEFDKQVHRFKGLLNYWLGLRSSVQVNYHRKSRENKIGVQTTAQNEERNLEKSIYELIQKMNDVAVAVGSSERIVLNEGVRLGAVETIVGAARNSMERVFRGLDGGEGISYPSGLNIETPVKRRKNGKDAPVELECEHNENESPKDRPAHQSEILEKGKWTMRNYNVGGIPVSIYFNSKYGTHFLPGLEALFGEMGDETVDVDGHVRIYFGVEPELMMEGQHRTIYSSGDQLRMMISAEEGMDYFGYIKKSILTMTNLWISMLSSVMARENYYKNYGSKSKPKVNKILDHIPHELRGLHEKLHSIYMEKPGEGQAKFEKLLPRIKIKEIGYLPEGGPGFDSGQFILMPIHGAAYTIRTEDGKEMNFVLPGDSGVGKSEVLREVINMGIQVVSVQADDMLYVIFDRESGNLFSIGTEKGAFTKMDDLPLDGKVMTSDVRPLVGYNAEEPKGNRRVVEPFIAKPNIPKKVDGILALVNAYKPEGEQRVKKVKLKELVKTWVEGPYRKSSSIDGGGEKETAVTNVPFWNEFGPNMMPGVLEQLLEEILIDNPSEPEDVRSRRNEIRAYIANTFGNGKFKEVAQALVTQVFSEAVGS